MRVTHGDSLDLGFAVSALITGAVDADDISAWAGRVIDSVEDPPLYIFTMLDLAGAGGRGLHDEIGFVPSDGLETEDDYQYLREIGVRRELMSYGYLAGKKAVTLNPTQKARLDELLHRNFGIDPNALPPLSAFRK